MQMHAVEIWVHKTTSPPPPPTPFTFLTAIVQVEKYIYTHAHTYWPLLQDKLNKMAPGRLVIWGFNVTRDDAVAVVSAGPCANHLHLTPVQTYNHASSASLSLFTGRMLFLTPNQQCRGTEGNNKSTGSVSLLFIADRIKYSYTINFQSIIAVTSSDSHCAVKLQ